MTPVVPVAQARRLALHAQGLARPIGRRRAGPGDVAAMVARIGALQLDPVAPVARSPLLVAHARLGLVEDADIEAAAYRDKAIFDAWAREASLVHPDDLALHRHAALRFLDGPSVRTQRLRSFATENAAFADALVDALGQRGPTRASDLEDTSTTDWLHGHWTDEVSPRQNVARMLSILWLSGRIGVGARRGQERLWDVFARCVPPGALDAVEPLSPQEFDRRTTLRALRLLGIARPRHVRETFLRGAVDDVESVLRATPEVVEVRVTGSAARWYAHEDDLEQAPALEPGRRTVALSPFDNLVADRARTAELFGFDHRLEIYVPADKRRWGYYVLPILHGERFVARADLKLDAAGGLLDVLALHPEPGRAAPAAVQGALERLAAWRGVRVR